MKALIISSRYPYSYNGGDAVRTKNLVYYINNLGYEVELLSFSESKFICVEDQKFLKKQSIIFNPRNLKNYFDMVFSIIKKEPIQCSYYINQNTKSILENYDFQKFDLIIIFLTRLSPILKYIKKESRNKVIFDMADILTINYKNIWKTNGINLMWKFIYSIEYFLIKDREKFLLKQRFKKLLVSERDFNYAINNLNGTKENLFVLPSHIDSFDIEKIKKLAKIKIFKRTKKDSFKICFIGNMFANHNHSSIVDLINSNVIMDLKLLDIEITIIGRMNNKHSDYYLSNGLNVIANPVDLKESAIKFDCGISLLNHCSGLQNKLYDYASLAMPIIATYASGDGIGFINKVHYLAVKDYKEFTREAIYLKNDLDFAYDLVINSLNYLDSKFTKEIIIKKLESIIKNK